MIFVRHYLDRLAYPHFKDAIVHHGREQAQPHAQPERAPGRFCQVCPTPDSSSHYDCVGGGIEEIGG